MGRTFGRLAAIALAVLLVAPLSAQEPPPPAELPWGGQRVTPGVPYQPSELFVPPSGDSTPLLLDESQAVIDPALCAPCANCECIPCEPCPSCQSCVVQPTQPQLPPGARDGVFQKIYANGYWLPQLEDDSLGWGDFDIGVVLGFPCLRRETPLLVTPWFGVHTLDGPQTPALPPRVYDAAVEFRHLRKFGDGPWAMDAAVTTGYYSDFEHSDSDAVRVSGRGVAVYESMPGVKWVLGAAYVNRAGASVLPIGGVIYEANPDMRWEILFPRPKVAWRLPMSQPEVDERWVYVGGDFGGGLWSIERPDTLTQDVLTYKDVRVLVGYERKITGGLSRKFEIGYAFGREIEFESDEIPIELDDTLFARIGLTY